MFLLLGDWLNFHLHALHICIIGQEGRSTVQGPKQAQTIWSTNVFKVNCFNVIHEWFADDWWLHEAAVCALSCRFNRTKAGRIAMLFTSQDSVERRLSNPSFIWQLQRAALITLSGHYQTSEPAASVQRERVGGGRATLARSDADVEDESSQMVKKNKTKRRAIAPREKTRRLVNTTGDNKNDKHFCVCTNKALL